MLSLTRKTEYALIAMCHLARTPEDSVVSARDIAEAHQVPLPLLMNVLKTLSHGGLVKSVRGARGGYLLARPAGEISLATLIDVVEAPVRLVRCCPPNEAEAQACELMSTCALRTPIVRVHEHLVNFLSGVMISELASDEGFAPATCAARSTGKVLAT